MFITEEMWHDFEGKYGSPPELETSFEMNHKEFQGLISSQKHGRKHDITFFIRKDNSWIVNSKHWYPQDLYRIPSGGIKPGESIEVGIKREAYEETGTKISLLNYFLRINVSFHHEDSKVDWVSHLVLCQWLEGEIKPIDTHEIKEARLAHRANFEEYGKIMLALDVGGFHYREFLHRNAFQILDQL